MLHPGAELRVGDVRDRAAVDAALEGVEAVFHQAAAVGVGQSMYEIERYVSVNTLGTAVLLEEILEHHPDHHVTEPLHSCGSSRSRQIVLGFVQLAARRRRSASQRLRRRRRSSSW